MNRNNFLDTEFVVGITENNKREVIDIETDFSLLIRDDGDMAYNLIGKMCQQLTKELKVDVGVYALGGERYRLNNLSTVNYKKITGLEDTLEEILELIQYRQELMDNCEVYRFKDLQEQVEGIGVGFIYKMYVLDVYSASSVDIAKIDKLLKEILITGGQKGILIVILDREIMGTKQLPKMVKHLIPNTVEPYYRSKMFDKDFKLDDNGTVIYTGTGKHQDYYAQLIRR